VKEVCGSIIMHVVAATPDSSVGLAALAMAYVNLCKIQNHGRATVMEAIMATIEDTYGEQQ